jgi:hypothetical protein
VGYIEEVTEMSIGSGAKKLFTKIFLVLIVVALLVDSRVLQTVAHWWQSWRW